MLRGPRGAEGSRRHQGSLTPGPELPQRISSGDSRAQRSRATLSYWEQREAGEGCQGAEPDTSWHERGQCREAGSGMWGLGQGATV